MANNKKREYITIKEAKAYILTLKDNGLTNENIFDICFEAYSRKLMDFVSLESFAELLGIELNEKTLAEALKRKNKKHQGE